MAQKPISLICWQNIDRFLWGDLSDKKAKKERKREREKKTYVPKQLEGQRKENLE